MLITNKKAVLGSKVKPVMKLIENLNEEEFTQLIDGMVLLFQGVQQFKGKSQKVVLRDDIDRAERVLEKESKKKNGKVAK